MSKQRKTEREGRGMSRRAWFGVVAGGAATVIVGTRWVRAGHANAMGLGGKPITVHASPTCGCCHLWVEHLKENGFAPTVEHIADVTPLKQQLGVPEPLWSCHTAQVDGYLVEGHVPTDLVAKMLAEKPQILGIAAPGMPMGAPGMEGPNHDRYEIVAFTRAGETSVYAVRG